MSCRYRLIASKIYLTGTEELALSGMIHQDGLLIFPKDEAIKYLDSHEMKYHIEKEDNTDNYGLNPKYQVWGWFKIDEEIPDQMELFDRVRFKWKWNFHSRLPLFLEFDEWYPSLDLGDDMCGTPIEARILDKMIHTTYKREINQILIDEYIVRLQRHCNAYNCDMKEYEDSIQFLKSNMGLYLHIWN